jgi:hypothetical protein
MKHSTFTDEQIAEVCHAANMAVQKLLGDECPSLEWEDEDEFIRKTSTGEVQMILAGASPEETHNEWCERLFDQGYICGLVKSRTMKTHPCLVPFRDLPIEQKRKVRMIHAIVLALTIDY